MYEVFRIVYYRRVEADAEARGRRWRFLNQQSSTEMELGIVVPAVSEQFGHYFIDNLIVV